MARDGLLRLVIAAIAIVAKRILDNDNDRMSQPVPIGSGSAGRAWRDDLWSVLALVEPPGHGGEQRCEKGRAQDQGAG
jgi:mevalonate pyrophosphate decarboxylase